MATVTVNGQEIELAEGERLNGIEVARRAGIDIPHYCWHPGLSVVASCRMCLVESGRHDPESGQISMIPKLVPACQTPATDGTVFVTDSPKVTEARAMVEEDLLIRHPIDCPICDKAGECNLQDYHFQHGRAERRADLRPFTSRRRPLGDTVTLFVDRCVMCTRCVRFCQEISATNELMVTHRGAHEEIDVFPGFPLDNKMSGNVVDLCPVGALGDKDFLYRQRVWFMKSRAHVCAGCSTGCSIYVDENQDCIHRLKPRENPHVNQWWMCDEGRYGWKHVHDPGRNTEPRRRDGEEYNNLEWSEIPAQLNLRFQQAGRVAVVLSPHLTVEESYLLALYGQSIDRECRLVLGPVPEQGEHAEFPNGFAIRTEKCPNRRGVEQILEGLQGTVVTWDTFLEQLPDERFDAVWISGGYKTDWHTDEAAAALQDVPLLVVQDLFPSPLWNQASYQLPGAAFAEREGSFVNHADRLQSFRWAIRPPAGVMREGQLYWQLLGRDGLYDARKVLEEIADRLDAFAVAGEPIPEHGVEMKSEQTV